MPHGTHLFHGVNVGVGMGVGVEVMHGRSIVTDIISTCWSGLKVQKSCSRCSTSLQGTMTTLLATQ